MLTTNPDWCADEHRTRGIIQVLKCGTKEGQHHMPIIGLYLLKNHHHVLIRQRMPKSFTLGWKKKKREWNALQVQWFTSLEKIWIHFDLKKYFANFIYHTIWFISEKIEVKEFFVENCESNVLGRTIIFPFFYLFSPLCIWKEDLILTEIPSAQLLIIRKFTIC